MPGRGPGLSSWSAYTALQRVAPAELTDRILAALLADGGAEDRARREAARRIGAFTALVEGDARRRIAEEKGPDHVANVAVRPAIDRLDFTAARKADLDSSRAITTRVLRNMKILAEGGTLAPPARPAGR